MDRELLTIDELAAELKVPPGTIYQWNYRGTGPRPLKVGRHVRYRRGEVDRWLDDCADPR